MREALNFLVIRKRIEIVVVTVGIGSSRTNTIKVNMIVIQ